MARRHILVLIGISLLAEGKRLWSSLPADINGIIKQAYPVGNGRLGAMSVGRPGQEIVTLNLDSLWTEGPFENSTYNGGNPSAPVYDALPGIREWIFDNGTGNISAILGGIYSYGTYTVLANLTVGIAGIGEYSDYSRALDLNTAVHTTSFSSGGSAYQSTIFCTFPDQVCVYHLNSTHALPNVTVGLENRFRSPSLLNQTCNVVSVQFDGFLADPGMQFRSKAVIASTQNGDSPITECSDGSLVISSSSNLTEVTIIFGAGSNYDQAKGNAENDYSFRGDDPQAYVERVTSSAAAQDFTQLLDSHIEDYFGLFGAFTLTLPESDEFITAETAGLIGSYTSNTGNPFVESLLYDYGRYLLIASSRDGSLPANLQGRWSEGAGAAWSADYHANINLQMNYWPAPQTGLGATQGPLWDYMLHTWVPYGQRTAELVYGAGEGAWVVHNEMNIFGYTGIKTDAEWANYPAAAAWMMHHVSDEFDYSGDVNWYQRVGYPLLKGVAQFWLSQLQEDVHFNDGTLVVNPCNSPEHGSTTFGCTHYQQLIWELFDRIITTWDDSGDTDAAFLSKIKEAFGNLDPGIHIGSWGQLQEWKIDLDTKNDTHRHLSELYGWYPGYGVSGVHAYNRSVLNAVETTLWSRGPGNGRDANAGWEKVWRSACWAGLNNTERALFELRYAIEQNFVGNGFSMYSGKNSPFQIDANFGLVGAVNAMLIRDLPLASTQYPGDYGSGGDVPPRVVILGPAIPASWAGGSVQGMRLRGGRSVDFSWDDHGVVREATVHGSGRTRAQALRVVNVLGQVLATA